MLKKIVIYYVPLIFYCCMVVYLSHQPEYPIATPDIQYFDKVLHFIEYGILGLLLTRALHNENKWNQAQVRSLVLIIGLWFGMTDELHQWFIPGRSASLFDLLFDGLGLWTASLVYYRIGVRYQRTWEDW